MTERSEIRDNMQIEWDVAIAMDDGVVLRADVFRPFGQGKHPVILSYGPYAKGLSFQEGYKGNWARLIEAAPEVLAGSTNKYQNWELIDPEKWVPDGYACVRVDSRGAGRSPGLLDVWSPRETLDLYHCVEWVGMQHGMGDRAPKSTVTGELVAGPRTLSQSELVANRADSPGEAKRRKFCDAYYAARTADFSKIAAPLLSAANWGGMGLHTRGNFEGYLAAGSEQKWLEVHGDTHFTHFYSKYGEAVQKRFFGYFLKGEDTGWDKQPRVSLNIRHPNEKFLLRGENEWPLARTQWTKYFLRPDGLLLTPEPSPRSATLTYETSGDGLTFRTAPMASSVEITGPVAAKIWLSSRTADADMFLALRLFDPNGKEITFVGSNDPRVPIGLGWLRASHRKLDAKETLPYRPWHTHDEERPLQPGQAVELDVEIWPTSIVVPPGYRLALTIRCKDYEVDGKDIDGKRGPRAGRDNNRGRPDFNVEFHGLARL